VHASAAPTPGLPPTVASAGPSAGQSSTPTTGAADGSLLASGAAITHEGGEAGDPGQPQPQRAPQPTGGSRSTGGRTAGVPARLSAPAAATAVGHLGARAASLPAATTAAGPGAEPGLPATSAGGQALAPSADLQSGSGAASGTTLTSAGVEMQEMIDSIRASIQVATRQGVAHARIALQPQELGEIRIHLSQSGAGLVARVTADTPAGAQALAGGRGELQRSLSSLGAVLLRLDIGSSAHQDQGPGTRFAGSATGSRGPRGAIESENSNPEGTGEAGGAPATLSGPALGAVVDVLA